MLYASIIGLTIIVAILLMVVILMQASKGGGLSATFGGAGGESMMSSRQAATVLHKATIYLLSTFLLLCLAATMLSGRKGGDLQPVTARALQEQSATSSFSTEIPVIPELPAGTGEAEEE